MPTLTKKPALPNEDKRWRIVNGTMRRHDYARDALIETLHTVQESFGYLDKPALRFVADSLHVPLSQAYGVATFYHYFTLKPPGAHTCMICMGTACYIKGAGALLSDAEGAVGVSAGNTSPTGKYRFSRLVASVPAAWLQRPCLTEKLWAQWMERCFAKSWKGGKLHDY